MPVPPVDPPVDPDVDLHVPRQRAELSRAPWETLGAISAGGVLGALARYGLSNAFPYGPGDFPWAVFWTNVAGCLLIGVLMVLITEVRQAHRLVRPFLGVGILGGFTTFSTYTVDVQRAVEHGAPRVGLAYLALTLAAALAAVLAGVRLTRSLAGRRAAEDGE
ncbi:fluoride efflux transporter FluC [Actinomadura bangladeshensis]|uniref:Fluoride-specific ion channel FluC n=1 Tax=Actinomadura bangladeshensis TaxID=453573 RepID=A0A6L9QE71_9ACTN|nr:CrcB family protein [Actinomadura bangladeshensis]NEA23720.1 CrcB family protein [Actinomadura bangladeshensis]